MGKSSKTFLVLAIVTTVLFCIWGVARTVAGISFDKNCTQYLKRAADANSIEMAKVELGKAISYAESQRLTEGVVSIFLRQPKNDIGYWYTNMVTAYEELESLPEDSTPLEKTNVLMKLRETLTDNNDSGTSVTVPNGISIYPNNVGYFLRNNIINCLFHILDTVYDCMGSRLGLISIYIKIDKTSLLEKSREVNFL